MNNNFQAPMLNDQQVKISEGNLQMKEKLQMFEITYQSDEKYLKRKGLILNSMMSYEQIKAFDIIHKYLIKYGELGDKFDQFLNINDKEKVVINNIFDLYSLFFEIEVENVNPDEEEKDDSLQNIAKDLSIHKLQGNQDKDVADIDEFLMQQIMMMKNLDKNQQFSEVKDSGVENNQNMFQQNVKIRRLFTFEDSNKIFKVDSSKLKKIDSIKDLRIDKLDTFFFSNEMNCICIGGEFYTKLLESNEIIKEIKDNIEFQYNFRQQDGKYGSCFITMYYNKDLDQLSIRIYQDMKSKHYAQVFYRKINNSREATNVKVMSDTQWIDQESKELVQDQQFSQELTNIKSLCEQSQQDQTKFVMYEQQKWLLLCKVGQQPYIFLEEIQYKLSFQQTQSKVKFDFLRTFYPPAELGFGPGKKIFKVEQLMPDSLEYKYVACKFLWTQGGRNQQYNSIKGTLDVVQKQGLPQNANSIIKIEKIYNKVIYERVAQELQKMLMKYPEKSAFDLMNHLFHGTRQTDPTLIYSSEEGFDIRFSANGAAGYGIYFADNSQYSLNYIYNSPQGRQMFMALVLTGESTGQGGGQNVRVPALKPGSQNERYDSFHNAGAGHYIIYDNMKSYPGYLITFK